MSEEIKGKYGCRWSDGTGNAPDGTYCGECDPGYENKCPRLKKGALEFRDGLIRTRDAVDFQLRFASFAGTKNVIIDIPDAKLFKVLLEYVIENSEWLKKEATDDG